MVFFAADLRLSNLSRAREGGLAASGGFLNPHKSTIYNAFLGAAGVVGKDTL
jgi:hypothetical protein